MICQPGQGKPRRSAHLYTPSDEAHTASVGGMHVLGGSADAAVYLQDGQVPQIHTTRYHQDSHFIVKVLAITGVQIRGDDAALNAVWKAMSLQLLPDQSPSDTYDQGGESLSRGVSARVQAEYTCQPEGASSTCRSQTLPSCLAIRAALAGSASRSKDIRSPQHEVDRRTRAQAIQHKAP